MIEKRKFFFHSHVLFFIGDFLVHKLFNFESVQKISKQVKFFTRKTYERIQKDVEIPIQFYCRNDLT